MLVPISWLKDFVDIDIPVEALAERLTVAGLEVAHLRYIGLPQTEIPGLRMPRSNHLVWDREKLLLGRIVEVKAHPNADKLVLALLDYGGEALEQCVTGAPNLFEYTDRGEINPPIWGAFAMEGARVWDGHSDKPRQMTLKGKALRGIHNKSMVCSEKELGISDEHEGVIILDHDEAYTAGAPLADVLGDIILDIEFTPNLARCFSMIGVAREAAALLDKPMRYPHFDFEAGRRAHRRASQDRHSRTGTEPALHADIAARHDGATVALLDAPSPETHRPASAQQHRRCDELSDIRAGAAAARLRL